MRQPRRYIANTDNFTKQKSYLLSQTPSNAFAARTPASALNLEPSRCGTPAKKRRIDPTQGSGLAQDCASEATSASSGFVRPFDDGAFCDGFMMDNLKSFKKNLRLLAKLGDAQVAPSLLRHCEGFAKPSTFAHPPTAGRIRQGGGPEEKKGGKEMRSSQESSGLVLVRFGVSRGPKEKRRECGVK